MNSKSFIVYPKTRIDTSDENIKRVEASTKDKLKSFISGYIEDYGEAPALSYIQSLFHISKQDAEMALSLYSK